MYLAIVLFAPIALWCFSFSRRPVRFAGSVAQALAQLVRQRQESLRVVHLHRHPHRADLEIVALGVEQQH